MSERIKPLFVIKPKTISRRDIKRVEQQSGICIVECSDPESARFLEPPIDAEIDVQARAALSLVRMIMTSPTPTFQRSEITRFLVDAFINQPRPAAVTPVAKVKR